MKLLEHSPSLFTESIIGAHWKQWQGQEADGQLCNNAPSWHTARSKRWEGLQRLWLLNYNWKSLGMWWYIRAFPCTWNFATNPSFSISKITANMVQQKIFNSNKDISSAYSLNHKLLSLMHRSDACGLLHKGWYSESCRRQKVHKRVIQREAEEIKNLGGPLEEASKCWAPWDYHLGV